jgi:hypothetical protein
MTNPAISRRDVLKIGAAGGTVIVVGGVVYALANRSSYVRVDADDGRKGLRRRASQATTSG